MSNINLTYSSELMTNYLHAEVISPQAKFEALQTNSGNSLLFAIGSDGVFNLVSETPGDSAAGWGRIDLSTAQISKDFAGQSGVVCRTFDAGQSVADATIGLAMVVETTAGDHLYLCLGNSNSDISWAKAPVWKAFPYDNPTALSKLSIVNVWFCEVSDGVQYIVVDVLRDPSNPANDITRYFIDPAKTNGYYWQKHDLPVDIESTGYTSCVGRLPNGFVDGMYTAGNAASSGQLVFSPMVNVFGDGPPTPVRLNLPGGVIPSAIAATRNADLSTNLFVMSGTTLYYFASTNQQDSAVAVQLLQNSLFQDVSHLYAYSTDTQVFLWGLNRANQVFYLTCPIAQIFTASAWSIPVPILTGADLISPYVNRTNSGNTIFAVGESSLFKLMQSPATGLWTTQSITLPAPAPTTAPQSFSSYTTTIQLTDSNGQPLVNSPLQLSTNARATFFINNLYYVLDPTPITITSDPLGNITLIECVGSLQGTQITAAVQGGASVQINPMQKAFNKVVTLNSVASLRAATVLGSDGTSKPLVSASVSDSDLQAVAQSNQGIANAYAKVSTTPQAVRVGARHLSAAAVHPTVLASFPDAIAAEAGDIFRWLESGVESVITIIEDAASGLWHFVATIAGKIYSCILSTVETIVGAVEWVFNAIKTAIEDLIKFLEFLFEWNDILITHRVMKNVFVQLAQNSINSLSGYKVNIASAFQSLINDVDKWADIPNFSQTAANTIAANPPRSGQNSSPANLGLHHFQGNASNAQSSFTPAGVTVAIFQDLLTLLQNEGTTLSGAYDAIKTDIIDQFDSLSVTDIIKKFVAIVVDTLLETVENILLAVVDVFVQLTQGMLDLFTATIDIPVISWLYKELSGDELSVLDLVCLISAIPATIVYKAVSGSTPFPSGDSFTQGLLNAQSWDGITSQFFTPKPTALMATTRSSVADTSLSAPIDLVTTGEVIPTHRMTMLAAADDPPVLNDSRLKVFGVVTGFFAFAGSLVLIVTSTFQRVWDVLNLNNPFAKTTALIAAVGNVFYVSPNIGGLINAATANWYQQLNNVLTGISIVKGFVNIPLATLDSKNPLSKLSPAVESVINVIWNVPVVMNIIENYKRWDTDYKSLIPESIGNFGFNFGGIMEFPIAMAKDPRVKGIACLVQYGLMLVYGICMPIAGGINEWT